MELVLSSEKYKDSYIEAVKEFHVDDDYTHRNQWYKKLVISGLEKDFDTFLKQNEEGHDVPRTEYWLIDSEEFIGRVTVRHRLNERLARSGGHIGFDIRPSARGKGYGNKILELALPKAKELGINRVLLTHDDRNEASKKIILKYGGVLENKIPNTDKGFEGHDVFRYWIDIR